MRLGKRALLVGLGDSLTYGWMVERGYLDFLEDMIRQRYSRANFRIINSGVPGGSAEEGLRRLERDVIEYNPSCVIVQFALNDLFDGCGLNRFTKNMKEIVEQISSKTEAEIVIATSVPLPEPADVQAAFFYGLLKELAEEQALPFVSVHEHLKRAVKRASGEKLVLDDGIHPTQAGCRYMAEAVMEVFHDDERASGGRQFD